MVGQVWLPTAQCIVDLASAHGLIRNATLPFASPLSKSYVVVNAEV
jgi:hypothetical protein